LHHVSTKKKKKAERPKLTRMQAVDLALKKVRTQRFEAAMRAYLDRRSDRAVGHHLEHHELPTKGHGSC
jgi:hypothetical protein